MTTFSYMNIHGLCPQTTPSSVPFLANILHSENHIFLALTETWLSSSHKKAELEIDGYEIYRQDRNRSKSNHGRYSGGVAFYIRNDISPMFEPILEFSNGVNEALLLYSKSLNLVIGVIYRQPTNQSHKSDAPEFVEMASAMQSCIETIEGITPDIYICGDFNIPHTIQNDTYTPTPSCNKQLLKVLNDFTVLLNLNQMIHEPTHSSGNILDFLLTNNSDSIFNYITTSTALSDHYIVDVTSHLSLTKTDNRNRNSKNLNSAFDQFNFYSNKIDWEIINEDFKNTDWHSILTPLDSDPDTQYETFINKCINIISSNDVPPKIFKNHSKKLIPRDRRILMRKRKKLRKRFSSRKTAKKLVEIEFLLQNSFTRERDKKETKATAKIKSNPKYFYSYANRFSKSKPKVGPLLDPTTNELTDDSLAMANILQNQYKSVFTQPLPNYDLPQNDEPTTQILEDFNLTIEEFTKEIESLSPSSAPGADGFPAILLLKTKNNIALPLQIIWRNILNKGVTPKLLKTGHITPVYKKGNQGLAENYRPVTLTSHVSKVFEKIVRNKIQTHLEDNELYNTKQHGFRKGRSCLSQLLEHTERLIHYLEKGNNVDVIYLDFSKAFDRVDHTILLHKLRRNGISGKLHNWIKSFLTNRTQKVSVNSTLSAETEVISGVPQGSVLGPLLFLIMIQDIDNKVIHAILSSFADDTRLMKEISELIDIEYLQNDLDAVYEWTEENNMLLNGLKFEHLTYGKNDTLKQNSSYYSDTATLIETKDKVKDLGVTLDTNLSYDHHIQQQIQKVKNISSRIYRTFKS